MLTAWAGIQYERGWSDETVLCLAERFMEKQDVLGKFLDYLDDVANEEDEGREGEED